VLQSARAMRNCTRMRRGVAVVLIVLGGGACSTAVEETPGPPAPDARPVPDAEVFPDATPLPPLRLDYADPDHGPFTGGTEVTLRGRGFTPGMTVEIAGHAVDPVDLQVIDGHRAVITTPPGPPGSAAIRIVSDGNEILRDDGFLYESIYVEPASGSIAGGTYVRIRGLGTAFQPTDTVTVDGKPMTGVVVVNGQELTGYTPPGIAGGADVRVILSGGGELFAEDAFRYETTVDPLNAGMGGGPIDGVVNVTLIDAFTNDGIGMGTVVVGDPATSEIYGITDPFGAVTLNAPGLTGPITVIGGHVQYESGAMVGFDAKNVAMYLQPLPDPQPQPPPGPFPPGRSPGVVTGDVDFGGTTSIGGTEWDLVPDPPTETARKRTYVFTTARDVFSSNVDPGPGGTIDYFEGDTAWTYRIPVRPTAFALVAVAGIYEPELDPDGAGPLPKGVFTPYAMGVRRNVLVGPGETIDNLSITINIPLDTGLKVELPDAPALLGGTGPGPNEYRVNALIDLGGEGVIRLPGSRAVFREGRSTVLTGLAPLGLAISDASYTIAAGAYSLSGQPYSIRIHRGVRDLSRPVVIDGFVGVPRAPDLLPDGTILGRRLRSPLEGGGLRPTWRQHRLSLVDNGYPVWRIFTRGDIDELPLWDLTRFGLPAMTSEKLVWASYTALLPGASFDTFNYGQNNANYWNAYSYASHVVAFPQ
jgi:hypothetical protein